jgi:hypothetical protein
VFHHVRKKPSIVEVVPTELWLRLTTREQEFMFALDDAIQYGRRPADLRERLDVIGQLDLIDRGLATSLEDVV